MANVNLKRYFETITKTTLSVVESLDVSPTTLTNSTSPQAVSPPALTVSEVIGLAEPTCSSEYPEATPVEEQCAEVSASVVKVAAKGGKKQSQPKRAFVDSIAVPKRKKATAPSRNPFEVLAAEWQAVCATLEAGLLVFKQDKERDLSDAFDRARLLLERVDAMNAALGRVMTESTFAKRKRELEEVVAEKTRAAAEKATLAAEVDVLSRRRMDEQAALDVILYFSLFFYLIFQKEGEVDGRVRRTHRWPRGAACRA
jgi:adenine-specific DNA glycosylase